MIRKLFISLSVAVVNCLAIPLHQGETLVWQVANLDNSDITYRTVQVLDSTPHVLGGIWRLAIRDSTRQISDTAKILRLANGNQSWIVKSELLAIELGSRPLHDTSILVNSFQTYQWGQLFVPGHPESRGIVGDSFVTAKWYSRTGTSDFRRPIPRGIWSDSLGFEQGVTFEGANFAGLYWQLVKCDTHPIKVLALAFFPPAIGSRFVWEDFEETRNWSSLSHQSTRSTKLSYRCQSKQIQWEVLNNLPDSGLWFRARVLENFSNWNRRGADTAIFGGIGVSADTTITAIPDSVYSDVSDTLDLRINRISGQSFSSGTHRNLEQAWWVRSYDIRSSDSGVERILLRSDPGDEFNASAAEGFVKMRLGAVDSMTFQGDSKNGSMGGETHVGQAKQVTRLLSVNGKIIRNSAFVSVQKRKRTISKMTLLDLKRYPQAKIRWISPSGRTGSTTAAELLDAKIGGHMSYLFLEAELPDGRIIAGSAVQLVD